LWLGLGIPAFAADDFWNDKDPSSWSDKEAGRLLNKSPWAKETVVESGAPGLNGGFGDAGRPGAGRSAAGGISGSRSTAAEDGMRGQPQLRVLIRWESATPMRQAARQPAPPLASQYYIITVSGLPASSHDPDLWRDDSEGTDTRQHIEDQLKQGTELVRKGKDPIHPDRLQVLDKQGRRTVVFLFSRAPEPLTLEDKEIIFASAVGSLHFKVRFLLKEMMYRGKLDL
jgi:hypothetical protein